MGGLVAEGIEFALGVDGADHVGGLGGSDVDSVTQKVLADGTALNRRLDGGLFGHLDDRLIEW